MKRIILNGLRICSWLTIGLSVISQACFAQQWLIGPKIGPTFNAQITQITGNARADEQVAPGFSVGLQTVYAFSQHIGLVAELNYTQKNLAYKGNNVFTSLYSTEPFTHTAYTLKKNYLEVPIGIRLQTAGRFGVFTTLGGYAGYWLSGKWMVNEADLVPYDLTNLPTDGSYPIQSDQITYSFDQGYNADGHKDRRVDLGVYAGLGIQYIFPWGNLWLEGRGWRGLTSLDTYKGAVPAGSWSRNNATLGAYAGLTFRLTN